MRIDILRQPLIVTLMLFAFFAALFWVRFSLAPWPEEIGVGSTVPLGALLMDFSARFPVIAQAMALLFIFSNGLSISRIISGNMVLAARTYLPISLYLIVSCGIFFAGANLAATVAAVTLLRATSYFVRGFVRTTSFNTTFRGAFLTGLLPLIYFPATPYMLMIPVAMVVFMRRGRETLVGLIGGLLPILICAYVYWIADLGFTTTFVTVWEQFAAHGGSHFDLSSPGGIARAAATGILGALTLLGIGSFVITSGSMRTRAKNIFVFTLMMSAVGITSLVFLPAPFGIALMAVPLSIIIPAFFARFTGWPAGIAYLILLAGIATLNLMPLLLT